MNEERFSHYKTVISHIDELHRTLLGKLETLLATLKTKEYDTDQATSDMKSICISLQEHFTEEEKYMKDIKFPFRQFHKYDHLRIKFILDRCIQTLTRVGRLTEQTLKELDSLYITHIDCFDIQVGDFVKQNS